RMARAFFAFDLSFLIQGFGEMMLQHHGVVRRTGPNTMNSHGDEFGHTAVKAMEYRNYILSFRWLPPDPAALDRPSFAKKYLAHFVQTLGKKGVQVVGGLPCTFDDQPIDEKVLETLRSFYTTNHAQFLALENRSQYPRTNFFDTQYHLTEENQVRHSLMLAGQLRKYLN
ncbi:MAG TPA: hypothetical protein VK633_07865, partial [Verrucomicrobiae bacterium]|nr:hypothetical protein [Verrucomicrobiae bacterium]